MRVLLLSPVFHGYWSAFAAALEKLGHDVVVHRYDAATPRVRVSNALGYRLGAGAANRAKAVMTTEAVRALGASKPDAVIVVKGDALGVDWWQALAESGARSAIWLYDELARMDYDAITLRTVGAVFSYSPLDVAALRTHGIDAQILPDGFDSLTDFSPRRSGAVNFIGARYPERERLLGMLSAAGEPVEAFGREWSRHPWDMVRTQRWRGAGFPAHRDVARPAYFGAMAGSLATLNIHGDGHDGFTMRTFEAPGVGALQLIDRADVAQHYEIGSETLVFENDEELLDHVRHARREPGWAAAIRDAGRRRTLAEHTLVHRMRRVADSWA